MLCQVSELLKSSDQFWVIEVLSDEDWVIIVKCFWNNEVLNSLLKVNSSLLKLR